MGLAKVGFHPMGEAVVVGYCSPMKTKGATAVRTLRQNCGACAPQIQDAQRAFVVLAMEPWGGVMAAARIKALCAAIPGVGALRVDADRGRIHVLYDGTDTAIEQVENAVRLPGHSIRRLGGGPASQFLTHAGELT